MVTFWAGEKEIEAGPGTFLHVPRGARHNFKNTSDRTARMLIIFAPAGIESMLEKMAADPDRYIEIGKQYGVDFFDEM